MVTTVTPLISYSELSLSLTTECQTSISIKLRNFVLYHLVLRFFFLFLLLHRIAVHGEDPKSCKRRKKNCSSIPAIFLYTAVMNQSPVLCQRLLTSTHSPEFLESYQCELRILMYYIMLYYLVFK